MSTIGNVLLALVIPLAWGLASAWVSDRLREWHQNRRRDEHTSATGGGE